MALDPVTAGIGLVDTVISRIWPDKTEAQRQELAAALSVVNGQIAINQAEAGNPSLFVSGWRPMIGWVCGMACAWNWIGLKVALFVAAYLGHELKLAPAEIGEMMPILMGMLGLGGLRTIEKLNDKAAK